MELLLNVTILSLLLVHELDAVQAKEWKMFIILKNMAEEAAVKVFIALHVPLLGVALYALAVGGFASYVLKIVVDVFVLAHAVLHFGFRKNSNNGFKTGFSKVIIYSMPVLAAIHLCLLLN
jgi:hypothetical protein